MVRPTPDSMDTAASTAQTGRRGAPSLPLLCLDLTVGTSLLRRPDSLPAVWDLGIDGPRKSTQLHRVWACVGMCTHGCLNLLHPPGCWLPFSLHPTGPMDLTVLSSWKLWPELPVHLPESIPLSHSMSAAKSRLTVSPSYLSRV